MNPILNKYPRLLSIAAFLVIAALMVLLMINARTILIPIVIAIGVWLVINDMTNLVHGVQIAGFQMPRALAMSFVLLVTLIVTLRVAGIFATNGTAFLEQLPVYTENLHSLVNQIPSSVWDSLLGSKGGRSTDILEELFGLATTYFSSYVSTLATSAANIVTNVIYIAVYVIFLLLEQDTFATKARTMFSDEHEREEFRSIMTSIEQQIHTYLTVKLVASAATALLSLAIILFFGLNHPFVWAIMIFILNFIPNIGSIMAIIFPVTMSILQFGNFGIVGTLFIVLTLVQVIVGSFIEPRLMGNQLNISPFVVLIALSVFGTIWGIIGMFLSVPLTVILMIVFSHFDSTRPLAVLLSGNGMVYGVESERDDT